MVCSNRSRCFVLASLLAIAAAAIAGPDTMESGTWSAQQREDASGPATVQLELHARSGNSTFSHPFAQAELRGFATSDGERQFSLTREAGTLHFEGRFRGGLGAGHYTFERSASFAAEMAQLGLKGADDEDPVFLALTDLGPRRVRELRAVGLDSLDWESLRAFAIHGVTPGEIEELRALGLPARAPEELIAFRIHGVSPAFIRGIRKAGLQAHDPDSLIALRIHGVTPEFVDELRGMGVTLTDEQAIALRIHGVSASYVRKLREAGYTKAGADDFVRLKIGGFDASRGRGGEEE